VVREQGLQLCLSGGAMHECGFNAALLRL